MTTGPSACRGQELQLLFQDPLGLGKGEKMHRKSVGIYIVQEVIHEEDKTSPSPSFPHDRQY